MISTAIFFAAASVLAWMVAAPVEVPTCVSLTHSQPSNRMVWLSARPAPTGEWHVLKSLQFRTVVKYRSDAAKTESICMQ